MCVSQWALSIRKARPGVTIGLLGDLTAEERSLLGVLASLGLVFDPVLGSSAAPAGVVGADILTAMAAGGIVDTITEQWVRAWDVTDPQVVELLRRIASHGVRGGRAYRISAHLGRAAGSRESERTIRRRLADAALPPLASLLRTARIESVELRMELGMRRGLAVRAAGWSSVKLYEKAVARLRVSNNGGGRGREWG